MKAFARYVGIDYSGAQTPGDSLAGLRIFEAEDDGLPSEVPPPPSPRKYWARREIAEWLIEQIGGPEPMLVGIDHGFSFPRQYFEFHGLKPDWPAFLDDFQRHWPTDEDIYIDFVLDGLDGDGAARSGNPRWRRLTEIRAGDAKSVFDFRALGSVAKSAHAGIPWLRFMRQQLGERVHFWPFDGWEVPAGRSVIAEIQSRMWTGSFAREDRTANQHAAYSVARWFSRADHDGTLAGFLRPSLTPSERATARIEGWMLGVAG